MKRSLKRQIRKNLGKSLKKKQNRKNLGKRLTKGKKSYQNKKLRKQRGGSGPSGEYDLLYLGIISQIPIIETGSGLPKYPFSEYVNDEKLSEEEKDTLSKQLTETNLRIIQKEKLAYNDFFTSPDSIGTYTTNLESIFSSIGFPEGTDPAYDTFIANFTEIPAKTGRRVTREGSVVSRKGLVVLGEGSGGARKTRKIRFKKGKRRTQKGGTASPLARSVIMQQARLASVLGPETAEVATEVDENIPDNLYTIKLNADDSGAKYTLVSDYGEFVTIMREGTSEKFTVNRTKIIDIGELITAPPEGTPQPVRTSLQENHTSHISITGVPPLQPSVAIRQQELFVPPPQEYTSDAFTQRFPPPPPPPAYSIFKFDPQCVTSLLLKDYCPFEVSAMINMTVSGKPPAIMSVHTTLILFSNNYFLKTAQELTKLLTKLAIPDLFEIAEYSEPIVSTDDSGNKKITISQLDTYPIRTPVPISIPCTSLPDCLGTTHCTFLVSKKIYSQLRSRLYSMPNSQLLGLVIHLYDKYDELIQHLWEKQFFFFSGNLNPYNIDYTTESGSQTTFRLTNFSLSCLLHEKHNANSVGNYHVYYEIEKMFTAQQPPPPSKIYSIMILYDKLDLVMPIIYRIYQTLFPHKIHSGTYEEDNTLGYIYKIIELPDRATPLSSTMDCSHTSKNHFLCFLLSFIDVKTGSDKGAVRPFEHIFMNLLNGSTIPELRITRDLFNGFKFSNIPKLDFGSASAAINRLNDELRRLLYPKINTENLITIKIYATLLMAAFLYRTLYFG
jgi:hypothetical protein